MEGQVGGAACEAVEHRGERTAADQSSAVELYHFDNSTKESMREVLDNYLLETIDGCEKHPSFVKGRNLVTYAVELMDPMAPSSSPANFSSGAQILDRLLERKQVLGQQHKLIKQLICFAPPSLVLDELLWILEGVEAADAKTRLCAARIISHLAGDLRPKQFPRAIHSVASLLELAAEEE
ncbi:hypothetical protein ABZP36_033859 [Zizania latifolia]